MAVAPGVKVFPSLEREVTWESITLREIMTTAPNPTSIARATRATPMTIAARRPKRATPNLTNIARVARATATATAITVLEALDHSGLGHECRQLEKENPGENLGRYYVSSFYLFT